ncbi:TonB-dependent receptor [Shewanella piezotolerans WP3]|uniref:TonB-dependent receptor n=1 Tax=Shewanella piezotolerans (strain WP3 / JCM 13877) TaxID=225849 RepID=B8CRI2_SHEPW|nr:TonB-dependent receptor [Shewanella piezotolerans]ACJ29990.1 TonB-dependent receptor [Shewanella piezotolerans WP3]
MKALKLKPIFVAVMSSLIAQSAVAEAALVDDGANEEGYERIVVTGSRLARAGADTTAPVTVVTAEELAITGSMNLNEMLATLPQFQGIEASANSYNPENAGLSTTELRDLGTIRTLVLVDGHRPTQTLNSSDLLVTDLNNIPATLVDRVEVLTGGASAVYGSDAVAGVVNIILKKDYEGLELNAYGSTTEMGDGEQTGVTLTTGQSFDDSKGNFVVSLDYSKQNELRYADRAGSRAETSYVRNKLDPYGEKEGIPDLITLRNVGWVDYNIPVDRPTIYLPDADYSYYQFGRDDDGSLTPGYLSATDEELYSYYKQSRVDNPYMYSSNGPVQFQIPDEKYSAYVSASYDFDNSIRLSGNVQYSKVTAKQRIDPEFMYSTWLDTANADFKVPQEVLDVVAEHNDGSSWIKVPYTFQQIGDRITENEREYLSASVSLEGDISDDWYWDTYLSSGKTDKDRTYSNYVDTTRFYRFETVGVCEQTNSCPEFNPFMPLSDETQDYLRLDPFTDTTSSFQHTVSANVNGTAFELPAGPLQVGFGAEFRQEGFKVEPSDVMLLGLNRGNTVAPQDVDRNITEGYVEVNIPVIADVAYAESVDVEAALRVAHYSTSGTNDSWKFGVNWAINDEVRVRSVYAKAVRAPQLTELFAPESTGAFKITDPCDMDNLHLGDNPDVRAANCQALGVPADFVSDLRIETQVDGATKGNEDLNPELAYTLTAGLVYTSSMLDNFIVSLDYYDIEIEDVITRVGAGTIVDRCVDSTTINNPFCSQVTRKADGNISFVNDTYVNNAKMKRKGIDFQANYDWDLNSGANIDLTLYGTYAIHSSFKDANDSEVHNYVGVRGTPEWKSSFITSYADAGFKATWQINYVSSTKYSRTATEETHDTPIMPSSILHNTRLSYDFTDSVRAYVGVTNVFDQDWLGTAGASTGSTTYPIRGRGYNAGFNIQF